MGSVTEKQLEAILGPPFVKRLKEKLVFAEFARLVEQDCEASELWCALVAIAMAWSAENPKREETPISSTASVQPQRAEPLPIQLPPTENTFESEIGFGRSELKTVIKRLRQCANDLERLGVFRIRDILEEKYRFPAQVPGWFAPNDDDVTLEEGGRKVDTIRLNDVLSELSKLPSYQDLARPLRVLALAAETAAPHVDLKGNYDRAAVSLVRYVHAHTGDWHDNEVAALIGAACDRIYDAEAHRKWRYRQGLNE